MCRGEDDIPSVPCGVHDDLDVDAVLSSVETQLVPKASRVGQSRGELSRYWVINEHEAPGGSPTPLHRVCSSGDARRRAAPSLLP